MKNKTKVFIIAIIILIIIGVFTFLFLNKSLKIITLKVREVNEQYIIGNDENNNEYKVYISMPLEVYIAGKKMNIDNTKLLLTTLSVEYYTNIFNSNPKEIKNTKKISILGMDVTIIVYLDNKITDNEIESLKKEVQKINNVTSIEFKSKKTTYDEFYESSIIDDFDGVDESIFRDELIIKVNDNADIIADKIKKMPGVKEIVY